MKKSIITVSGLPGSGKSETAKGVARALGYGHFSSGDLFRQMAAEQGLSIEGINAAAERKREIDDVVDQLLVRIGEKRTDLVIDSRTAFHWIPDSFKVYLDLDPQIAAERTFAQIQKEGRASQGGSSVEEIAAKTAERSRSEQNRFRKLYGIDYTDRSNYDLVVDTKRNDLAKAIELVVAAYRNWLEAQ